MIFSFISQRREENILKRWKSEFWLVFLNYYSNWCISCQKKNIHSVATNTAGCLNSIQWCHAPKRLLLYLRFAEGLWSWPLGRNHLCVTSRLILTKKHSLIGTLISSTNDLSSETYSPTSVPLSQTHISSFTSHVRLQRLYSALLCVALICRPARVIPVFLLCVVSDWLSDGVLPWYANPGCWQTICITWYYRAQAEEGEAGLQLNRITGFLLLCNDAEN